MKVVFLAGGFGTRLSEETNIIPKPMIEIGGKPLLWHLMKHFAVYDKNKFIVALGYKGEIIKDYFTRYSQLHSDLKVNLANGKIETLERFSENWEIELIDTGPTTMTGGRLKRLRDNIDGSFIFTYGDGLSNIDIKELVKFHKSHGKLATITAVTPTQRFGLLKLDNTGRVKTFSEKPNYMSESINGGFFVLEPEVIDYIDGDCTVWEKEPCERLAADGQMMAYRHHGFWQCVDTLHELRSLRELWNSGSAEWKTWR